MTLRSLFLLPLALVALLAAGCSPAWWQQANENPVLLATSLDGQVHTFLSSATLIYTAAAPLLPADKKAEADAAFQKAVIGVNHALAALEDAAQAAQETHQDKPDLTKQVADVLASLQELVALVDTFKDLTASPKATAAGPAPKAPDLTGAYAAFTQSKTTILRRAGKP